MSGFDILWAPAPTEFEGGAYCGKQIEVVSMRFPIRKTFFNRLGGEY